MHPETEIPELTVTLVTLQGEHSGIDLHGSFRLTLPHEYALSTFSQHSRKGIQWGCLLESPQLWKPHE